MTALLFSIAAMAVWSVAEYLDSMWVYEYEITDVEVLLLCWPDDDATCRRVEEGEDWWREVA